MYKRLIFMGILGILSAVFLIGAEKPKGEYYTTIFSWEVIVDSTSARQVDTFLTLTGSSAKIFRNDYVADYGTVLALYLIEYINLDTGTAGVVPDTAKDTVIIRAYTADEAMTANKQILLDSLEDFHVTASVANTDYNWVTLSDSALASNVYFTFESILDDSTYTKARLEAGITYKVTVWMWMK